MPRKNRSGIDWNDPAARAAYKRNLKSHKDYNQQYHETHKPLYAEHARKLRARRAALRPMRRVNRPPSGAALRFGESHPRTHLTDAKVREIRRRRANGETCQAIANDYGLQRMAVSKICRRITWKHVE